MTTFQMNGKTYRVVPDTPDRLPCQGCAFQFDAGNCAQTYLDDLGLDCVRQDHSYEEVPAQPA